MDFGQGRTIYIMACLWTQKRSPKASLQATRNFVSSTLRSFGLCFFYDDLSEERSAVHQLKYAILKTPIFKNAHHLKFLKFSTSRNMVCPGAEIVNVLYLVLHSNPYNKSQDRITAYCWKKMFYDLQVEYINSFSTRTYHVYGFRKY